MAPFCVFYLFTFLPFYLFTSLSLLRFFTPILSIFSSLPIKMRVVSQTSLYFCIH
ncbi:hypothetical protein DJ55_2054 [Yersinia pseudotuberculosis]|nr:hypothetical protein DJ55_2054 [Yersinia pseudotuberculosis]